MKVGREGEERQRQTASDSIHVVIETEYMYSVHYFLLVNIEDDTRLFNLSAAIEDHILYSK